MLSYVCTEVSGKDNMVNSCSSFISVSVRVQYLNTNEPGVYENIQSIFLK